MFTGLTEESELKNTVIFIITDLYADWEYAFLAAVLQDGISNRPSKYEVKTMSVSEQQVKSIGGFVTISDYRSDMRCYSIFGNEWVAE